MRFVSAFTLALVALLMASCATTDTVEGKKIPERDIQSVTFVNGSLPVPAQQRRDQSLKLDSDLSAKMEIKNGYNKVLSEKEGKITQAQFDELTKMLNAANYVQLKPGKPSGEPVVGKGKETLIITSDLGAHRFINGGDVSFPEPIKEIFAMKDQYLPE